MLFWAVEIVLNDLCAVWQSVVFSPVAKGIVFCCVLMNLNQINLKVVARFKFLSRLQWFLNAAATRLGLDLFL